MNDRIRSESHAERWIAKILGTIITCSSVLHYQYRIFIDSTYQFHNVDQSIVLDECPNLLYKSTATSLESDSCSVDFPEVFTSCAVTRARSRTRRGEQELESVKNC